MRFASVRLRGNIVVLEVFVFGPEQFQQLDSVCLRDL